ncbi:MAG: LLM class flavin-dependent oxidoreductase [Gammaproteobacteria bacterium]|nr:LLM class flavin-dependent oxidoreductase [Gammaproteobacteria bacterium]
MPDSAVSYGFLLPTRELVMSQSTPDVARIIELAERAEALGFDSVWAGDSILARPRLEAFTTLAAVAARARRVKVGTAVLLPALRHPVVMANEAANVDLISEGRLILGLGIAAKVPTVRAEFAACGVSIDHRIGIFEETVTLMRRLWREPNVTFNGRHFRLQDVSLGLRPHNGSSIPIWIAGSVDNALRRVARLGDGWYPNPVSPQVFAEQSRQLAGFTRDAGRGPQELHRCVYTTLNINDDAAQAERETRAFAEGYYNVPYEAIAPLQSFCFGTPDTCIAWLRDLAAAGAQTIVIRFACPDQAGQLERCAADILPHVAA